MDAPIRIESLSNKKASEEDDDRDDLALMEQMMKGNKVKRTGWAEKEGEESNTPKDQRESKEREEDCEVESVDGDELPLSEKKAQPLFSARKGQGLDTPAGTTTTTTRDHKHRRNDEGM